MKAHKINLIITSLFALLVVLGCSSVNRNVTNLSASKPLASERPIYLQAEQLTKDYDENELAADGKYKTKSLEVLGRVSDIAETMGKLTVQLEGHKQNGINLTSVMCSFDESERANIARLKKGQLITLTGIGDGKTLGFYVGLNQCKVK
jgi:hypothetical protein